MTLRPPASSPDRELKSINPASGTKFFLRLEHTELAATFFLFAMGTSCWIVPLSTVLDAYGLGAIIPYAFATSAVAALVSPLIFGATADRHVAPARVLRWSALATTATMALATTAIKFGWGPWLVLALIQLQALCSAPSWSIASAIAFARLTDSSREFGPIRVWATVGWMAGCWLVSALNADASALAGYSGACIWLVLAAVTYLLPHVEPPKSVEHLSIRQRLGLDALSLLKHSDHRVVFLATALFAIPLAAFYPFTPPQLRELGLRHTTAWMTLAQTTEFIMMFVLARLLVNRRFKWVFAAGLFFGFLRYAFCVLNGRAWVLAGVTLHGFAFTMFFITGQIYLDQRVDQTWRVRAQALMSLANNGVGSLIGYLGTGWWFQACGRPGGVNWRLFWGGLTLAVGAVLIYFIAAYRGRQGRMTHDAAAN